MKLHNKLFDIRHEIEGIQKNAENPYFKSDYLTLNGLLDALNPLLKKHNVLLMQPTLNGPESIGVLTQLIDLDSEERVESETLLPMVKHDPQAAGSAISYARRYSLMSLFSIKAEDDDGNTATFEDKSNTYQLNEIKKLVKELDKEEALQEVLGRFGIQKIEDMSKTQAQSVLEKLRKARNEQV
jgi:hypothetical protein